MGTRIRYSLDELMAGGEPCGFLSAAETIELVEGRLGASRLEAWRAHLESCAACSDFDRDRLVFDRVSERGLSPGEERAYRTGREPSRRRIPVAAWWAPALVAAALAIFFLLPEPPPLVPELERVPLLPPPTIRGETTREDWDRIESAWSRDDFATAESLLEDASRRSPDAADLAFYLGWARLYREDAAGAVKAFRKAVAAQADSPSDETLWALAAALDRIGERTEACSILDDLARSDGRRAASARTAHAQGCP